MCCQVEKKGNLKGVRCNVCETRVSLNWYGDMLRAPVTTGEEGEEVIPAMVGVVQLTHGYVILLRKFYQIILCGFIRLHL